MSTQSRTLLLSQGYEPIKVISWQRAITLLTLGKVEVIEEYDNTIRTTSVVIKMPAVVRLLRAFRRHAKPVKFSRVNIYARDGYKCQYCGVQPGSEELTIDHVVPRAQGGESRWDNCVLACVACNKRKADRTPEQARMRLHKRPVQPTWNPRYAAHELRIESWSKFVSEAYWNVELEG